MTIVNTIFIAVHILSMAAIVGGWLANFKKPTVTTSQWYGAIFMIISGVVLFGLAEMTALGILHNVLSSRSNCSWALWSLLQLF